MIIAFDFKAFEDFKSWVIEDKKIFARIGELIKDVTRDPFKGIDKLEPLKHALAGYWSRRITDEHRLVYKVENDTVFIASCKFHY
jgi:toxin YoeB